MRSKSMRDLERLASRGVSETGLSCAADLPVPPSCAGGPSPAPRSHVSSVAETLSSRQGTHGDFSCVAECSQVLQRTLREFFADTEHYLSAVQQEALQVICSKLSRIVCGNPDEVDHWHDIQGYAALVERELNELKEVGRDRRCE